MSQTTLEAAPNLVASTQSTRTWKITNNCGKDIVVIDAYADTFLPDKELYSLNLVALFDQQEGATDPKSVIPAGKSGTISFGNPHKDKDSGDPLDYTIIIARADTLFPIKIVEIETTAPVGESVPDQVPDLEVKTEDLTKMELAQVFKKYLMALPDSKLALDYTTAVTSQDESKLTAFFAGTTDFKKLDQEAISAVTSYYEVYPYAWTDYKASKTYYLYNIDKFEGQPLGDLTVAYTGGFPMNTDQTLANFTVTYTPTDSDNSSPLTYSLEQFVAGPADAPTTLLLGTFRVQGELTGDTTASSIISCIVGIINGKHVFGVDVKAPVPDDPLAPDDKEDPDTKDKWWGFYDMLHDDDMKDYGDALIYVTGVLIGVFFLGKLTIRLSKAAVRKLSKGKYGLTDEQKLDKRIESVRDDMNGRFDGVLNRINQVRPGAGPAPVEVQLPANAPAPQDALANLTRLRANRQYIANQQGIEILNRNIEIQQAFCERIGAIKASAVRPVADILDQIQTDLLELSNNQIVAKLDEYLTNLKYTRDLLNAAKNNYTRNAEGQAAQNLEMSRITTDQVITEFETNKTAREEALREQQEQRVQEEILENMEVVNR